MINENDPYGVIVKGQLTDAERELFRAARPGSVMRVTNGGSSYGDSFYRRFMAAEKMMSAWHSLYCVPAPLLQLKMPYWEPES